MLLNELFNKTLQYKWFGPDMAEFWIGSNKYVTAFEDNGDGVKEVAFAMIDKDGEFHDEITGDGNAIAIFGTVFEIIHAYIQKSPAVTTLVFTAKEASRKKLYARFVKNLVKQGWTANESGDGQFSVTRPSTNA